ncbi:type I-E CRISPR-associated protein Cse1/CasA [Bifidobacterium sp. MA2]|uniref:Type I-E CRISPR-associated protein Cse1/CasA n=1 Tax=Bifidobacterium santillanense TaxID=2809028 RepID=A0ABS5ULN5_9BIFI|nr:type I-E CRISPR-associated protein Cse1/CasA [Bifidobacterium santillanense]MBT1171793.1 type I-E CRISPR-associated protein Cse1/CasA [Bifidobacterium santillanense]
MNEDVKPIWNLIDRPWLPCVCDDGGGKSLSLRNLFHEAPHIRSFAGDLPQQSVALLRLALAVLYRAYALRYDGDMNERDLREMWSYTWQQGRFDTEIIDEYLDGFHDRFYLIHPTRPFYQVPGLSYAAGKDMDAVGEMIADVPKPDKFLFSMRSQKALDGIDLAQAARWLVFLQAFDTAGIKSPVVGNTHVNKGKVYAPKGAIGTGWLGAVGPVFVEGGNLFETLMLNWCLYGGQTRMFGVPDDLPPWELDEPAGDDLDMHPSLHGPVGMMTLQSRRIRLIPDADRTRIIGLVDCYGDIVTPINKDDVETMTAWRESPAQQKKLGLSTTPLMPVTHNAGRALWRGLAPILEVDGGKDRRPAVIRWVETLQEAKVLEKDAHMLSLGLSIHAQGMTYGTQSSVYETGIDDTLALDMAFLRKDYPAIDAVTKLVSATDDAVRALANYVQNLRVVAGDKSSGGPAQSAADQIREETYGRLDGLFRDRIAGFTPDEDVESYGNAWRDEVYRTIVAIGRNYEDDDDVSAFSQRDAGRMGTMNADRARRLFYGALNKALKR